MVYSHAHRFIFCHVPRTGGTSITQALCAIVPDARVDGRLYHHSVHAIRDLLGIDYPAFGFCRNPFSRAVSWYGCHYGPRPATAAVRTEFAHFLRGLAGKYWLTAWQHLAINEMLIDTEVCRYETLAEDFGGMCRRFGLTGICGLPHEHDSRQPCHYAEYYTDDARDRVLRHSAADFEKFGYATTLG